MARLRRAKPYRPLIPVICVGNFTAGGSGKTPLAILLARIVSGLGREPWFLSRGYGGTLKGPLRVEPATHSADEVGDEPLLLARHAPTIIAQDRRRGAEAIEASASQDGVIIMDDGLQNPALAKNLSIAVVDTDRGFGNGYVIPAGPLRAPLAAQIGLAGLIVITGRRPSGEPPLATKSARNDGRSDRQGRDAPHGRCRWPERTKSRRFCRDRQSSTFLFDARQPRRRHRRAAHVRGPSRLQRGRSRDASRQPRTAAMQVLSRQRKILSGLQLHPAAAPNSKSDQRRCRLKQ